MHVFVVFIITQAAKDWLIQHGAAIGREQIHDLQIVYLPVTRFTVLRCTTDEPSMIALRENRNKYILFEERENTFHSRIFTDTDKDLAA